MNCPKYIGTVRLYMIKANAHIDCYFLFTALFWTLKNIVVNQ